VNASAASAELEGQHVGRSWLVRMRVGAIASELTAIVIAAAFLGLELPLLSMLGVIALSAASNVWLLGRTGERLPFYMAAALLSDIAVLTALLYWGGGASNPFSAVYLVYSAPFSSHRGTRPRSFSPRRSATGSSSCRPFRIRTRTHITARTAARSSARISTACTSRWCCRRCSWGTS
jgi:two-component system, sensor histidine kinase RegB